MDALVSLATMRIHPSKLLGWPIIVCGDLLLALCVFLFLRRCMGFLSQPLEAGMLVTVAVAAAVVPSVFRLGWQRCFPGDLQRTQRNLRIVVPSCGVLLLAVAVSLPGSPPWALAFLWFAIAVGEGTWWVLGWRPPRSNLADSGSANPMAPLVADGAESHEPAEMVSELPLDVSQQLTRSSDGRSELVYGTLRCRFEPGERSRNLHLAFCPPLAVSPQMAVHQVEGPTVTIKTGQVESFGARLELRLARRSWSHESVVVGFEARAELDGATEDAE